MTNKDKAKAIAQIQEAARSVALSFEAFRSADKRLAGHVNQARKLGFTEAEIEQAIAQTAPTNPRVRQAVIDYSEWLMAGGVRT